MTTHVQRISLRRLIEARDQIQRAIDASPYERKDIWEPLCQAKATINVYLIPWQTVEVHVNAEPDEVPQ